MKTQYYIKVWSDYYKTWQLSGAVEVCNPYPNLNAAYVAMNDVCVVYPMYRYIVVDDKVAQPPRPT